MPNLWWPVSLGFCPGEEQWHRLMSKCGLHDRPPYPEDGTRGATFSSFEPMGAQREEFSPFGVITVADTKGHSPSTILGMLVHESVHAFQWTCEMMGERLPSKEFEAYSIQNIYQFMEMAFSDTRWKDHGKVKASKDPRAAARKGGPRNRKGVSRKRRFDKLRG